MYVKLCLHACRGTLVFFHAKNPCVCAFKQSMYIIVIYECTQLTLCTEHVYFVLIYLFLQNIT